GGSGCLAATLGGSGCLAATLGGSGCLAATLGANVVFSADRGETITMHTLLRTLIVAAWTFAATALLPPAAHAQSELNAALEALECAQIEQDRERLRCYDAALRAPALQRGRSAATTPEAAVEPRPQNAAAEPPAPSARPRA